MFTQFYSQVPLIASNKQCEYICRCSRWRSSFKRIIKFTLQKCKENHLHNRLFLVKIVFSLEILTRCLRKPLIFLEGSVVSFFYKFDNRTVVQVYNSSTDRDSTQYYDCIFQKIIIIHEILDHFESLRRASQLDGQESSWIMNERISEAMTLAARATAALWQSWSL